MLGTLTEDGLDMKCILPVKEDQERNLVFGKELNDSKMLNESDVVFLEAMARINQILIGDPLDCKMFEFTNWDLIEPMPEQTKAFNLFVPTIVFPKNNNESNVIV